MVVKRRKNIGVDRRIAEFFAANPGEELTYSDIVLKFDTCYRTAYNAVQRLKEAGVVEPMHVIRAPSKARP